LVRKLISKNIFFDLLYYFNKKTKILYFNENVFYLKKLYYVKILEKNNERIPLEIEREKKQINIQFINKIAKIDTLKKPKTIVFSQ
jgi:hypothetical protein